MRLVLSAALALWMCRPCAALAQGNLLRAWIDPKSPKVVMGQFSGGAPVELFDTSVRSSDAFAPASAWKISRFSQVSLSPDGSRVAFKAEGANASAIGVFKVESRAAQIIDTSCDARALTWSPTGRYLVVEDAQGLLNNTIRLVGGDDEASEIEISGDVLSDMGYSAYRFRNDAIDGGKDIWRTEVSGAQWTSERTVSFKVKRVHLRTGPKPPPEPTGTPAEETWRFDVVSKKFAKP